MRANQVLPVKGNTPARRPSPSRGGRPSAETDPGSPDGSGKVARRTRRVLLITSPKGGTGKSSLARNILVAAARTGITVLGIDLDPQETLGKWGVRRQKVREAFSSLPETPVVSANFKDWRTVVDHHKNYDLVVVDTPPGVELHLTSALNLGASADLVLVPVGATQDDVDSASPWMAELAKERAPATFVLNKANRRTKSYLAIRTKLLLAGRLCPVEIPLLEDVHVSAGKGLGILDFDRGRGNEYMDGLWAYISRELGL